MTLAQFTGGPLHGTIMVIPGEPTHWLVPTSPVFDQVMAYMNDKSGTVARPALAFLTYYRTDGRTPSGGRLYTMGDPELN